VDILTLRQQLQAVQFKMASGNIDDGTIQMFGIL
jgi:hypothetical protein